MSPHIIATVTIDDHHHSSSSSDRSNENYSPSSQDMSGSPKPKGRILYCRKCEGHGEKVILKNHSPQCPYILCNCKSCEKLNYKRLKSFNKRNKEKIELAAALNAKRHVTESGSSVDDEEAGYSRRSSFSSKTSTPEMDSGETRTSPTTPITRTSPIMSTTPSAATSMGLEGRSGSLGHMTVMSYDIWKAKCASEKKRLEDERAKKTSLDPFTRSPSPTPMRKRAHTFVAQPTTRLEDIPVVAPKKMSVDEKAGRGKYILLPTIPAMRIFVNDSDEEKNAAAIAAATVLPQLATSSLPMAPLAIPATMTAPIVSIATPITSILDIPSTSSRFQTPSTLSSPMLHQQRAQISPFKPVGNNLSAEQGLSSLILHNAVIQQQQQQLQQSTQIMDLLGGQAVAPAPTVNILDVLRMQQQAASLAAFLQSSGVPIPPGMMQKPQITPNLLNNPFLQSPLFTNPV